MEKYTKVQEVRMFEVEPPMPVAPVVVVQKHNKPKSKSVAKVPKKLSEFQMKIKEIEERIKFK